MARRAIVAFDDRPTRNQVSAVSGSGSIKIVA